MLVASTPDLEQLVSEFSGAEAYAIDTEFHGEGRYYPRLAVIQLAVPGRVAVVDATAVDLGPLQRLFDGPAVAVPLGYSSASLAKLVREFLGRGMDKGSVLSDWFQRPLSAEQIAYAEADVAHLLELRAVLETRLAAVGRLTWATDECERLGTR